MCKMMEEMRREEREEGIREGMRAGMREGRREGVRATARRMLAAGKYSIEEIAAISGLSLEEVGALKRRGGQDA